MDALWFGCIPVLIADYYVPPLMGLVQWDSIAITVPEAQINNLKKILVSIPSERVRAMQLSIQKVGQSVILEQEFIMWEGKGVPKMLYYILCNKFGE